MSRRAGGTLLGIALLGFFLTGGPAGAAELYQGRGVVLAIDSQLNLILIRHEEIPGFMPLNQPMGCVTGVRRREPPPCCAGRFSSLRWRSCRSAP